MFTNAIRTENTRGGRKKKNCSIWVTVLPIWKGMCLLVEVKGQRYIEQFHEHK